MPTVWLYGVGCMSLLAWKLSADIGHVRLFISLVQSRIWECCNDIRLWEKSSPSVTTNNWHWMRRPDIMREWLLGLHIMGVSDTDYFRKIWSELKDLGIWTVDPFKGRLESLKDLPRIWTVPHYLYIHLRRAIWCAVDSGSAIDPPPTGRAPASDLVRVTAEARGVPGAAGSDLYGSQWSGRNREGDATFDRQSSVDIDHFYPLNETSTSPSTVHCHTRNFISLHVNCLEE